MSNTQGRVAKRRKKQEIGPLCLGNKIVRVGSTLSDRHFTVHEDLLCTGSELFRSFFQCTRKPIEGQCSICYDELDPIHGDLTFCRGTCGHNLHVKCWERWADEHPRLECPMCRANWTRSATEDTVFKFGIDPDALQTYLGWLYSGEILFAFAGSPTLHRRILCELCLNAETIEDTEFQSTVMASLLSSLWSVTMPSKALIEAVFEHTIVSESLRNLLIDLKIRWIRSRNLQNEWFKKFASWYPSVFVGGLAHALLNQEEVPTTLAALKKKYLQEDEDEQ